MRARVERYRRRLLEAFLATLRTAAAAGALTDDQLQARAESLAVLAISVNWTATAAGPVGARQVADAARALVDHDLRRQHRATKSDTGLSDFWVDRPVKRGHHAG